MKKISNMFSTMIKINEKHRIIKKVLILIVLLICFKIFFMKNESCVSKKLAAEKSKQERTFKAEYSGNYDSGVSQTKSYQLATIDVDKYVESATRRKYHAIPRQALPWWDDPELRSCKDPNTRDTVSRVDFEKYPVAGNCGYRSFLKGYNQSVVSFSLYGSNENYWSIMNETFHDTPKYYPGWQVRVYLNPRTRKDYLCKLLLEYQHVSVCDVENLPPPLGNIESSVIPMLWRSAPMGDPTVKRLAVRDSDSVVSIRSFDM